MEEQVQEALKVLFGKLEKETPELTTIMDRAKRGELSEFEAMAEMMKLVREKPAVGEQFTQIASQALQPTRQKTIPSGLFQPATTEALKLNPLISAALAERLQFDGDIPEMRTGPKPGVLPAIPIATSAVDPVYIGKQMEKAAKNLEKKLEKHHKERQTKLESIANEVPSDALAMIQKHGALLKQNTDLVAWGSAETDHPQYKRGQVPAPIKAPSVSASALANLTPGQCHEMAWRFLSTTQGRRTAVQAIQETLCAELEKAGVSVYVRAFNSESTEIPLATHEWTLALSGPGATQPAFSFISVAGRALSKGLLRGLNPKPSKVILEVAPVNRLSDRIVGWGAKLFLSK